MNMFFSNPKEDYDKTSPLLFDPNACGEGVSLLIDDGHRMLSGLGRDGDFMKIASGREVFAVQMPENGRFAVAVRQFEREDSPSSVELLRQRHTGMIILWIDKLHRLLGIGSASGQKRWERLIFGMTTPVIPFPCRRQDKPVLRNRRPVIQTMLVDPNWTAWI